jgi:hypothetical protein
METKEFITKDSGQRKNFESGMVRDTDDNKVRWDSVADGPMLRRWAELMTRGKTKYPDSEDGTANWLKATGKEELIRFRQSAFRHFMQWYNGELDEDHAAAVLFNINGAEHVKNILNEKK